MIASRAADAHHHARIAALEATLRRRFGREMVVTPFSEGVDAFIDQVLLPNGQRAILRTARIEKLQTTYDGPVDWADELEREVVAAELVAAAGMPVPRVLAWSRADPGADERSWMLAEFVEHSRVESLTEATQYQLGQIARRIHDITPTGSQRETLARWRRWEPSIVDRIMRRIEAARAYVELPDAGTIRPHLVRAIAGREEHADRLLHLDLRAPNLGVVDDQIIAVFDFGNAICGDPYLELARVEQCDLLSPAFQEGYGLSHDQLKAHAGLLRAYSLDVTALLVVVSRDEFDDPVLHRKMIGRTLDLLGSLLV